MNALAAALEYAERGWATLPLAAGDKRPHATVLESVHGTPQWGGLSRRPASPPEIRAWFEVDSCAGIGIITGAASGLAVVDIDQPAKFKVRHPPTPTVTTARGRHLYFRTQGAAATRRFEFGELRGDGSYVVAPPSRHQSGAVYSWAVGPDDTEPADVGVLDLDSAGSVPRQSYMGALGHSHSSLADAQLPATGDRLATVEAAVVAALPVLGIAAPLGASFPCVIPGHEERRPSASIYRGEDNVHRYRDWHARDGRGWWSLAEVYFAQITGRRTRLTDAPTLARWWRRLFAEAGVIELAAVELPALPAGAPDHVERVRRGFELLAQIREGQEAGEPMPFTRRFAADWCAMTERQAREGIEELKRLGVIEKVGEHPSGHGRPMNLYRPGHGPATFQRAERRAANRHLARSAA